MLSLIRLIALCYLLMACNAQVPTVAISPEPIPPVAVETLVVEETHHVASTPIGPEYPVANVKKVFTVKIVDTNYSPAQKLKLREAEAILAKIFNSEEYKKEILTRKFTNTNGLTNAEIYEKLFAGAEALLPAVNYQMDLTVEMYYSRKSTVGYTYPNSLKVMTNSRFHNSYSACEVASNLAHEFTHKMTFGHSSARDKSSLPYSHNDIVKSLCLNSL